MLAAVQGAVSGVTGAITVGGKPYLVDVAIGWPPENRLQDVARSTGKGVIGIYDRKVGRNTTRWAPYDYNIIQLPSTLSSVVSGSIIDKSTGSATITLGGPPTVGDGVSAVFLDRGLTIVTTTSAEFSPASAQVVVAVAGDTAATMAAKLAAAINADALLSTWVSAAAAGPVVTVSALSGMGPFLLASHTGNGATATREVGRRERQVQIACWTNSEMSRDAVCDPIAALLAQIEINFSLTASDGSPLRLVYDNDYDIEEGTLQDVYRRDLLVTVEFPITVVDTFYAILAPELSQFSLL